MTFQNDRILKENTVMVKRDSQMRRILLIVTATIAAVVSPGVVASQESASAPLQMASAHVWLNKAIDAKKSKQGDAVSLKVVDDVKIPNSHDLPKNTILLGHVDTVQPSQNKSDSTIQVTFDKAQLKDGQVLPIKVTILRIIPSASYANLSGGSLPSGQTSTPSTGAAAARNPGSAAPPPGSPVTQGGQPAQAGEDVNGVSLKSDVNGTASGTFVAKGRNVSLGSGTELQIGVVVVPANTPAQ
jgi:hypothetical protein